MIYRISALELGLGSCFLVADKEGMGPNVLDEKKYIHCLKVHRVDSKGYRKMIKSFDES